MIHFRHVRRQIRADLLGNLSRQEIVELDGSQNLKNRLNKISAKDIQNGIKQTPPSTSDKELSQYTTN